MYYYLGIGLAPCVLVAVASLSYLCGFNKGITFLSSSKPTPAMPLIKAFGKKTRKSPKFVSEEEQWKREQREAPADPA